VEKHKSLIKISFEQARMTELTEPCMRALKQNVVTD